MELLRLNKEEVRMIYQDRMLEDFPADERKPLDMIYRAMDREMYVPFGLVEGDRFLGYTFVEKLGRDYLIDYVAIWPEQRNRGIGGQMLALLKEALKDADSLIGEVEDPDFADSQEEKELQTRRIGFYMRNGLRDTNARVVCFGVPFRIIEIPLSREHTDKEALLLYEAMYRAILPEGMYEKHIILK